MQSGLHHSLVTRFQEQAPQDGQAEVISSLMTSSRSLLSQVDSKGDNISLVSHGECQHPIGRKACRKADEVATLLENTLCFIF